MSAPLDGRIAVVTGGSSGIGLAIARRLSRAGAQVAIWDIAAVDRRDSEGYNPDFLQSVDVSDLKSVEEGLAATFEALGQVDILVNNAGITGPVMTVEGYPAAAWHSVLAVDLTGVFYCTKTLIGHMSLAGHGRIVNMASIAGKEGNPWLSAYAAAKAGVIGFTKSVAREVLDSGILVNCVAPALSETRLLDGLSPEYIAASRARIPMGRLATVDEIASIVAWIVGPDCTFTTGFTFDVSGGRATY